MEILTSKPDKPEVDHCDLHGAYEYRYIQVLDKWHCTTSCPKCAEIDRRKNQEAERERAKELHRVAETEKRLKAGISKRNLNKGFDFIVAQTAEQKKAKKRCIDFIADFLNGSSRNMIMTGGVGTGKTLMASAMIEELITKGKECRIIRIIDLIRDIRSGWKNDSELDERAIIKKFVDYDLLFIDEIGIQNCTDSERLHIFDVIDGRYQDMRPTILISNLDIEKVKSEVGERVVDRLREDRGALVVFNWQSFR